MFDFGLLKFSIRHFVDRDGFIECNDVYATADKIYCQQKQRQKNIPIVNVQEHLFNRTDFVICSQDFHPRIV